MPLRPRCLRPHGSFRDHYLLNGWLTILNRSQDSIKDPQGVALAALGWVLADDSARAERLLALTGPDPRRVARRLGEPATHRAVLEFLCAHEPDLVAAADALGVAPAELAAARERIAP